jgi:cGMP-dependent protein kinase
MLSGLSSADLAEVGRKLEGRQFPKGKYIIREGEPGDKFYILADGTASVMRKDRLVTKLRSGDHFGETALLNNAPRTASVIATTNCLCLFLRSDAFKELAQKLDMHFAMRGAVSAEVNPRSDDNVFFVPDAALTEKSPEVRQLLLRALQEGDLTSSLRPELQEKVCERMWRQEVKAHEVIIRKGEAGDFFYILERGQLEAYGMDPNERPGMAPDQRSPIAEGSMFGVLALLHNEPRSATVEALSDSVVWKLDRFTYRRVVAEISNDELKRLEGVVGSVPLFAPLSWTERKKIAEAMEEVKFRAGTVIVRQGDEGDRFFLLASGTVSVTRKEAPEQSAAEMMRLKAGDYFGERALITDEPRAATVTAVTDVRCLFLDRAGFKLLLSPLNNIIHRRLQSYASMRARPRRNFQLADFTVVCHLGRGSFGRVSLVRYNPTDEILALKVVSKAQVVKQGQQSHLANERAVMEMLNHHCIVRLHGTMQTQNFVMFVLEACLGGEMFTFLRQRGAISESAARFYAGSVVLALEHMHNKGIVFRDLKPENLVMDQRGYAKITDFGFAKVLNESGKTFTLCGTPDYLAPEVLNGSGHDTAVDCWTLGVLVYEMIASYPPFQADNHMATYKKILAGSFDFPPHFSAEAQDLCTRLLQLKPLRRLTISQVKQHSWFEGFDWKALEEQRMKPPYVPKKSNKVDLSHFRKSVTTQTIEGLQAADPKFGEYRDDGSGWDMEF